MILKEKIRSFIMSNVLVWEEEVEIADDDNIFKLGFVNSLFAMKLLNYIEKEFSIKVDNTEMNISNFSTVDNICALVNSKLN
jgi:methoxymalonate biosynthesis acyl carrier protein